MIGLASKLSFVIISDLRPQCDISDYQDDGKVGPAEAEEESRGALSSLLPFYRGGRLKPF